MEDEDCAGERCRVCSQPSTEFAFDRLGYTWRSCPSCGILQKALSLKAYRALRPTYDPGSFAEQIQDEAELRSLLDVEEKAGLLRRTVGHGAGKAFLEVGCGMGGYLLAARDLDYKVRGVEPSTQHSAEARRLTDLEIMDGYYEPGVLGQTFDVIMLSHVIEHIYSPGAFLASLVLDLAPGGRLVVITPNAGSFAAKLLGKHWSMLKPIDHVSMLTKRGLLECCPEAVSLERLSTSEWPGEFAAQCASAMKSRLRSARPAVEPPVGSKHKRITMRSNLPRSMRAVLAMLSAPFWLTAKAANNQACLLAVFSRRAPECRPRA